MLGIRNALSQRSRNSRIDLILFLRCPTCLTKKELVRIEDGLHCEQCAMVYPAKDGVPVMYPWVSGVRKECAAL